MRSRTFATYEESKHLVELTGFANTDYLYKDDKGGIHYDGDKTMIMTGAIPAYSLADIIGIAPHMHFDTFPETEGYTFTVSVHKTYYPIPIIPEGSDWFQMTSNESHLEAAILMIRVLKDYNLI